MSPYHPHMILDKTKIKTQIVTHPDLRANPKAFTNQHFPQVRKIKPTRGKCEYGPTWNLTLDILVYKGIKVKLRQVARNPLTDVTIEFNPGVCLYAHNGRILLLTEFLDALTLLVTTLRPLLSDPDEWVDLIPGLRPGGRAYWSYLEVLFQCRDTGGALLARLRHLRQPSITNASRHWPDTIKVGPRRGKLQLAFYRKAVEMGNRRIDKEKPLLSEEKLKEDRDILRLEARMKDAKLVHHFGNGHNVEVIDGMERLVWFWPQNIVNGHRKCLSELQGVFATGEVTKVGKSTPNTALGQTLAQAADDPHSPYTLPQLIATIKHYTGATDGTIRAVRNAGMAELSRRSPFSSDDLFSDAAYATQVGIASEVAERLVYHEFIDPEILQTITKRYRPEGQPFRPHIELPSYTLKKAPDEDDNHDNDR